MFFLYSVTRPQASTHQSRRSRSCAAAQAAGLADEGQVLLDVHVQVQGNVFGQVADAPPHVQGLLQDIDPIHRDRARVGGQEGGDDLHGRALAGAVGAQEAEDFSPVRAGTRRRRARRMVPKLLVIPRTSIIAKTPQGLALDFWVNTSKLAPNISATQRKLQYVEKSSLRN